MADKEERQINITDPLGGTDRAGDANGEKDEKDEKEKARKDTMRRMLSLVRKAVQEYDMIPDGSKVCVGISGGKDSIALLTVLAALKRFYPKHFDLQAVTVSMGFEDMDFTPVARYCETLDVPYFIEETKIKEIVFDIRHEKNPCALCANLRRGALNDCAKKLGCDIVALGHHRNDVVETAFLSLSYEGRFYCFEPKTYLERRDVTVIRPMIFVEESEIRAFMKAFCYPVVKNPCPMDTSSKRATIKETLNMLNRENHIFRENVFGAVKRGIWDNK